MSVPSALCSRQRSLALSVLNPGHPPRGQDGAGTSHPPSTLVEFLHKSEPAWHWPGGTHLFWSWKWETNPSPEAEPALHSPSAFSAVLPALAGSMLAPQGRLHIHAKAKRGSGTGAGGGTSAPWSLSQAEDGGGNELMVQKAAHLLRFIADFVQPELPGSAAGELRCLVTA